MDASKLNFETPEEFAKAREVDDLKLSAFAAGQARKSKFVKEKEAAEAKRKEEEELAAKAYRDFVAAFEGDKNDPTNYSSARPSRTRPQAFVRASGGSSSADPVVYNPLSSRPAAAPSLNVRSAFGDDDEPPTPPAAPKSMRAPPPSAANTGSISHKRQRAGDSFLEELKRKDAEREERLAARLEREPGDLGVAALAALESAPHLYGGSRDTGDPLSTNVHIGNLPITVTDSGLGNFCARWGPIASLKIMWPRLGNEGAGGAGPSMAAARSGLNGFVAFMERSDAERACRALDGTEWGGNILRANFGKAMPLGPRPIYELPRGAGRRSASSRRRSRSISADSRSERRSRDRSHSAGWHERDLHRSRRRRRSSSRDDPGPRSPQRDLPRLEPTEEDFIRKVARKVKEHGHRFEATLRDREANNPKFAFLRDSQSPSFHFFRMLLDRRYRPPSPPPPPFEDDGYASVYSSDSAEESEAERCARGKLGKLGRKRFEAMLRAITPDREPIARCMAFALQHADAADEIVTLLSESLTVDATPVPRKMARLYVVSDILHNSSNSLPNAWKYRQAFEKALPDVFDHLNGVYRSFPSRLKAEGFRAQVEAVLQVWQAFMIFAQATLDDMADRLNASEAAITTLAAVSRAATGSLSDEAVEPQLGSTTHTNSKPGFAVAFMPATRATAQETKAGPGPLQINLK